MEELFESDLHSGFRATSEGDGSINNFNIACLFGTKALENIQDKVARATGLTFVTADYRGEPITEMISSTPFCQQVHKDENVKRIYTLSGALGVIQAAAARKTYVYFCLCGLIEIAIPTIVRGRYPGSFIGEQIRCGDAPADVCRLENVLHHNRNHREDPGMNQLFKSIAVHPHKKLFHIANLTSLTVNRLAEKGLSRPVQKENLGKELEVLNKQKKGIEVELAALRTQMNSYSPFKSLNTISNLPMVEDTLRTNRAVNLFIEFMKFNFSETRDNVFVSDEIGNLGRYLKIQKERMGDQLQYVLDISDELNMQKIPSRTLLPFVERVVFYEVGQKKEHSMLRIAAQYRGGGVVLQMEDDGPGFSDKKIAQLLKQYKGSYEGGTIEASITPSRQRLVSSLDIGYDAVIRNVDGVGTTSTIHYPKDFDEKAN